MHLPTFFTQKKQTMRRKLFGYMLVLALLLVIVIFTGLFLLGHYSTASEKLHDTLSLQMEMFEREITSHHENLAMRSARISKDASNYIEYYLHKENLTFDDLENSPSHIENLEGYMIDLLSTEILQADCSGAFILFDTTVNSSIDNSENSRAGVYIQRNSTDVTDNTLLLYRGNAQLGKSKGVVPHRKWRLEFDSRAFPDYARIVAGNRDLPLEKNYYTTEITILPGTSEKVMLLTMPVKGYDGRLYGICGFEMSASSFKNALAQPSTLDHLVCTFSPKTRSIDAEKSFVCGVAGGYYLSPRGKLRIENFGDGLFSFGNADDEYIGIVRDISISSSADKNHTISVMIPKYDYNKLLAENLIQTGLFILLLIFFAVSCCGFFSKKYISPVLKKLDKLKQSELDSEETSSYSEIDDLFEYLGEKERELSRVQSEVDKLSYERKTEIAPDDYQYFKEGLKTLTRQERNIFDMYLSGKTAKEILEISGIKERTLKFHNGNIYDKLGVRTKKELLRFATLLAKENSTDKKKANRFNGESL